MIDYRNQVLIDKAARDAGFDVPLGAGADGARFKSSHVPGEIAIGLAPNDGFVVAIQNPSVRRELFENFLLGRAGYRVADGVIVALGTLALQEIAERVFQLSGSLPTRPLDVFRARLRAPETTEVERLVRQRVGQEIFRESLDLYWAGRCAVTNLSDRALLRASHIRPWAMCDSDEQRLDVFNGLLLAAHLDAAFDAALMSFDENGLPIYSYGLSMEARLLLEAAAAGRRVQLTDRHQHYLEHHRLRFGAANAAAERGQRTSGTTL